VVAKFGPSTGWVGKAIVFQQEPVAASTPLAADPAEGPSSLPAVYPFSRTPEEGIPG